MERGTLTMDVRSAGDGVAVVDITGEITSASEPVLMDAFSRATVEDTRAVILDFSGLEYMNSGGVGLLLTMLVGAHPPHQRPVGLGLTHHHPPNFSFSPPDGADGGVDTPEK